MPRKNANTRPPKNHHHTTAPTPNPTCEQLARALVNRGLCTPQILDHKLGPNTNQTRKP